MIIVMKQGASDDQLAHVVSLIEKHGLKAHVSRGVERTIIGCIGDEARIEPLPFQAVSGVERVMPVVKPYRMAARETHPQGSVVKVGGGSVPLVEIGSGSLTVMAGPCAVENAPLLDEIASSVKDSGAHLLRGGAFKPRTSPYAFQGLGVDGLKFLREAGDRFGLPVVSEVRNVRQVETCLDYVDMFQVGARNMQNFDLLMEVGRTTKPVLLKRGLASTVEELLMSAEYVMSMGNHGVVLCERGIRTFEKATRFTLDVSAVPILKRLSHLPVIVDPSHAAGQAWLVPFLALAAVAAGADGIIVEVHSRPEDALCDGDQALLPDTFRSLVHDLNSLRSSLPPASYAPWLS
ncbi:MAG: 3-deoxy-7-phosphoheptulonate synthase [Planctomycetes bacterium]|nr:3-deoxy-7-phosphoheptulonate synthase [Planctomycetota bacterium]